MHNVENGGWKKKIPSGDYEVIEGICGNVDDLEACIKDNTHGLDEAIYAAIGWGEQRIGLMDRWLWREDFTVPWYGVSHTLIYPEPRGGNWKVDMISLYMNKSDGLNRRIFLHDPNFFILDVNPHSLPINHQNFDASMSGRYFISRVPQYAH